MNNGSSKKYLRISGRPHTFYGTIRLPPSKSYLHRALFVSALASGPSTITNCGSVINDDIEATIGALKLLGSTIKYSRSNNGSWRVLPGSPNKNYIELNAGGSGTTARFLIPFSVLSPSGTIVKILGNESLSKRPMEPIFEPLSQLGTRVRSTNNDGKLPVEVEGGGITGGDCQIDGSISSQFVSALLLSCEKARKNTIISIKNPEAQVSTPYIEATLQVLRTFGFKIQISKSESGKYSSFKIQANQSVKCSKFSVPGDMSSAAALIGAAMAARGSIRLTNSNEEFPQSDSAILPIAKQFGAKIARKNSVLSISFRDQKQQERLSLDCKDSPDLVPTVAGLAAATGTPLLIKNIEHLRFKESDRIGVLARELSKIGVATHETRSTLRVSSFELGTDKVDNTLICPEGDHRMLMALTIAGLSGSFGSIYVEDPNCVRKSYPSFVADLQKLCHEKSTLKIVSSVKLGRTKT